jgi:hypothetical protein
VEVKIADLRLAAERILKHLEDSGHATIDIPWDYYWTVPAHHCYGRRDQPTEFTLGQLSDDWSEIKAIRDGKEPIGYALVWLASLLRAVGERVVA